MALTVSINYKPLDSHYMKNWKDLGEDDKIRWDVITVVQSHIQLVAMPHTTEEVGQFFLQPHLN